jgi:hypothetical protein
MHHVVLLPVLSSSASIHHHCWHRWELAGHYRYKVRSGLTVFLKVYAQYLIPMGNSIKDAAVGYM